MRARFNAGRYFERAIDSNDSSVHIGAVVDVGPAPRRYPRGNRSQMVEYLDRFDRTIAHVHQYGRQSGRPCRGTLPDPKYLYEGGVRYKHDPSLDPPG
jgi:hypothetical protein